MEFCYSLDRTNLPRTVQAHIHEMRGLATSIAFENCVAIEDIVQAGSWSSPLSFMRFYLKDFTITPAGRNKIGTIVAAQSVVMS